MTGTDAWAITFLSLHVAAIALVVMAPVGIALGWLLARRDFPGKWALDALVHLPLVLPPVVTGWLLLILLGRRGLVGAWLWEHWGIRFVFDMKGAVIAAAVMGLPLMVRAVRLAIGLIDRDIEHAAACCGAGPWRVLMTVTLPLAGPGILAGLVLSFARALGEFGATITLAGNIPGETRTLPVAIYTLTQVPDGDGPAWQLIGIAVVLAIGALIASELIARRIARRLGLA